MKKETKDLVVTMVNTWNQFNRSKRVDSTIVESEFSKGHWSIELEIKGVVNSDFMTFLQPALYSNDCIWFFAGSNDTVVFHIQ